MLPFLFSFNSDDQIKKIQHRKCYIKRQTADASNAKDDEVDLLGEGDGDSSLVQMQTLRVLLTIFLPPPVLSPYPSVLYHLKRQSKLSHPPQVLPCNKKSKQILKNPWAIL